MKILGVGGSLREDSHSYKALRIAMAKVPSVGFETEIVTLRDFQLPFCHGGGDYDAFPDVVRLRRLIKEADAIILAAPEYHGSVSGPMKNALDLLDIEHAQGKVIALISVCGGVSNTGALNALRLICRWLHAFVIPEQIVISNAEFAFNGTGELYDEALDAKMAEMMASLIVFASKLGR